jgi:hypothetical protein
MNRPVRILLVVGVLALALAVALAVAACGGGGRSGPGTIGEGSPVKPRLRRRRWSGSSDEGGSPGKGEPTCTR